MFTIKYTTNLTDLQADFKLFHKSGGMFTQKHRKRTQLSQEHVLCAAAQSLSRMAFRAERGGLFSLAQNFPKAVELFGYFGKEPAHARERYFAFLLPVSRTEGGAGTVKGTLSASPGIQATEAEKCFAIFVLSLYV